MFSEGHKQLPSLVKAGMSHMAPRHALIRRVLQLRVGPVAIKDSAYCLPKLIFSRTTAAGAQRIYRSPPQDLIGVDKAFLAGSGWITPQE